MNIPCQNVEMPSRIRELRMTSIKQRTDDRAERVAFATSQAGAADHSAAITVSSMAWPEIGGHGLPSQPAIRIPARPAVTAENM